MFPRRLITHLASVPGFSDETLRDQWALARMLWMSILRTRQHNRFEGWFRFSKSDARAIWGSDQRMRDVVGSRYFTVLAGENLSGYANAFQPSDSMAAALQACLADRRPDDLVEAAGTVRRKFPRAIASKSADGKRNCSWAGITPANSVRIDAASLAAMRRRILSEALGLLDGRGLTTDEHDRLLQIRAQVLEIDTLISLSCNTVAPGHVPVRYGEAATGRLFGIGPSLQNTSRDVRSAALAGCWDYDISNCHWAFVVAQATAVGCPCPAIEAYLRDKTGVRTVIAEAIGIDAESAKECLLMTIYGAKKSLWEEGAIVELIGEDAARRLYRVPAFLALHDEVASARRAILAAWTPSGGGLVNAVGLRILASENARRRLAHLLQGMEAQALKAVVRDQGENVQVCIHDGWVTRQRVPAAHMARLIEDVLGVRVELEERRLDPVAFDANDVSDEALAVLQAWGATDVVKSGDGPESKQPCGFPADLGDCYAGSDQVSSTTKPLSSQPEAVARPSLVVTRRVYWNLPAQSRWIAPRRPRASWPDEQ